MKLQSLLNNVLTTILLVILVAVGINIADFVYGYNPQIARGILGTIVVYLIYRNILLPIKHEPVSALFVYPGNIKYFLYAFLGAIIVYWGLQQTVLMFIN